MSNPGEARIDKWLWAARIYKTRTLAADACKNGRISINGANVKASRSVKVGDKVITAQYAGSNVKLDGEEYLIVNQEEILAIVE